MTNLLNVSQNCRELVSVTLPDDMTVIPQAFFSGCTSLRDITLPPGLETIKREAFLGCVSLRDIELPVGLRTIGRGAFDGCVSLGPALTLPDGLQTLETCSFRGCTSLTGIYLPASITSITVNYGPPFQNCGSALVITTEAGGIYTATESGKLLVEAASNIIIDGSLLSGNVVLSGYPSMGAYAFDNNTKLTGITFTDTLTTVAACAFRSCTNLVKVDLPVSINTLANDAFTSCTGLLTMIIRKTDAVLGTRTPINNDDIRFYVPDALVEEYRATGTSATASYWKGIPAKILALTTLPPG